MFFSTTYTELSAEFHRAAKSCSAVATDSDDWFSIFGNGGNYILDTPQSAPDYFTFLAGNNLDNDAKAVRFG